MLEGNKWCSLARNNAPIVLESRDWWNEDTTVLGGSCRCLMLVCGLGVAEAEDGEGIGGRYRVQTTWIPGLKGWPDRVNLNNSEQKTASLLTSPHLHFHWQLSNKHTPSSKDFQKQLQLVFFHQLKEYFFFFSALPGEKRKQIKKAQTHREQSRIINESEFNSTALVWSKGEN